MKKFKPNYLTDKERAIVDLYKDFNKNKSKLKNGDLIIVEITKKMFQSGRFRGFSDDGMILSKLTGSASSLEDYVYLDQDHTFIFIEQWSKLGLYIQHFGASTTVNKT